MYSEGANRFIFIDYLYFDITYVARYYPDTYSLQTADLSHCAIPAFLYIYVYSTYIIIYYIYSLFFSKDCRFSEKCRFRSNLFR